MLRAQWNLEGFIDMAQKTKNQSLHHFDEESFYVHINFSNSYQCLHFELGHDSLFEILFLFKTVHLHPLIITYTFWLHTASVCTNNSSP